MVSKLEEDIHTSISDLKHLLLKAGANDICDILEGILNSSDEVTALHKALRSQLKRQSERKDDANFKERRRWFQQFTSNDGTKLGAQESNTLAHITSNWELSEEEINALLACSMIWSTKPELFWFGEMAHEHTVLRCYEDLRRMDEVDPFRRKVILIILAQHVGEIQETIRLSGRRGREKRNKPGKQRERVFLPSAMHALVHDLWPQLQPIQRGKIKKRLTEHSLYGWKWMQLAQPGIVLSLQHAKTKKFERFSWSSVELEALNQYVSTLPQYQIRSYLSRAMSSITSYYVGGKYSERAPFITDLHSPTPPEANTLTPESEGPPTAEEAHTQNGISIHGQPIACSNSPNSEQIVGNADVQENSFKATGAAGAISITHHHSSLSKTQGCVNEMRSDQILHATSTDNAALGGSVSPQTNFEPQPVLNPLPPFSGNLHSPIDWEQAYSALEPPFPRISQANHWSVTVGASETRNPQPQAQGFYETVSNPLPPLGATPTYLPLGWDSLSNPMSLQDFAIVDSLSNPLPPFNPGENWSS